MRVSKISNPQLKRAVQLLAIDDTKLITIAMNYGLFGLQNNHSDELSILAAITKVSQRLKNSRAKQQKHPFYEIEKSDFLLKTDEQQDSLIDSIKASLLTGKESRELENLDTIASMCHAHNLDLEAVVDHIEIDFPFFPCCNITDTEIQQYIIFFTENADTYRRFVSNSTRLYADAGYRGICNKLLTSKLRRNCTDL